MTRWIPFALACSVLAAAPAPAVAGSIAGYATRAGVSQGDTLELHVSTEAPSFDLLIEDALEPAAILAAHTALPGTAFAVPESAFAWGCQWPVTHRIPVPESWPSGVYYARLIPAGTAPDTSFVPFVVLEDEPGSTSPILFQLSTNTYNAYNAWGGRSLYPQNSQDNRRSYFVSTQRPYDEMKGQGQFPWWERPLAAWLRTEGIPVEFCTNLELDRDPDLLASYRLFLSVGHDEYYSKEMYDRLEAFRSAGGNLAFFGGNSVFWQVRFAGETMVCYKDRTLDPYYALGLWDRVTVNWRSWPLDRPEGRLIGVQYDGWCWRPCGVPLRLLEPNHWTTRGLGLGMWAELGTAVVGYEWDHRFIAAQPQGLDVIFLSYIANHSGDLRFQHSSYYEYPPENPVSRVFAAGTIQWSWGVRPDSAGADTAMTRITRRIVRCLSQPPTLEAEREVVFVADLRLTNIPPNEPVWLRGQPAPLEPLGDDLRMLDDGVPPDSAAGDRIYTRAVSFPTGSWDVVKFSYWAAGSPCDFVLRSAWIEDPDLGPGPTVVLHDRPQCQIAVDLDDLALDTGRGDGLVLTVGRGEGGLRIEVVAGTASGGDPPGSSDGFIRAVLYDIGGRLVRILYRGFMADGRAEFMWDGSDEMGRRVPRGIYLLDLKVGDRSRSAKIVW